ncbi:hypothetical protein [Aureimonas sp. AU40]|uniref:hypothetical protein n=1 Tax=Aureimonas sp. AU40 TaxID=1637747 RepID=UPI00078338A9|nr:hypothetical protein [Aureimonas sp. AU40]
MGIVTTPGFYGGSFLKAGQHIETATLPPSDKAAVDGFSALTRSELLKLAEERGMSPPSNASKLDLVALLEAP